MSREMTCLVCYSYYVSVVFRRVGESGTPNLECGLYFRDVSWGGYNISTSPKLQFCKGPFGIVQEEIASKDTFKNMVSKLYLQPVLCVFSSLALFVF